GSVTIDGQLGIRGVHYNRKLSGTERFATATPGVFIFDPVQIDKKDTYWLPNINARIAFTRELQLRLAATKTRTRPQFNDLNPSISIGRPPDASCNRATVNCETGATAGYPNLKDRKSPTTD